METIFRCRVEKSLLEEVDKVAQSLGTSTDQLVRAFLAEIAQTGSVPVNLNLNCEADPLINKTSRDNLMRSFGDFYKSSHK